MIQVIGALFSTIFIFIFVDYSLNKYMEDFTPQQSTLQRYFEYKENMLVWKIRHGSITPGRAAGCSIKGRRKVRIDGRAYDEKIVIWILLKGEIPENKKVVNIWDGWEEDNRIENLKLIDI